MRERLFHIQAFGSERIERRPRTPADCTPHTHTNIQTFISQQSDQTPSQITSCWALTKYQVVKLHSGTVRELCVRKIGAAHTRFNLNLYAAFIVRKIFNLQHTRSQQHCRTGKPAAAHPSTLCGTNRKTRRRPRLQLFDKRVNFIELITQNYTAFFGTGVVVTWLWLIIHIRLGCQFCTNSSAQRCNHGR